MSRRKIPSDFDLASSRPTYVYDWGLFALVLVVAALVLLWDLGAHPLKNWDESIYALVSKEMVQSGDWVTPRFESRPWFEKPPLYIWVASAFFRVFGISEFSARLPSALSGVGLVAIVYLLGRLMYTRAAGALAALIVLTAFQIVQASRLVTMDVMLTFFILAAIYFYVRARVDARWWYLVATSAALAFLTKGFAAIVAPAAIFLAIIFDGRLKPTVKDKHFWLACAVAIALIAPWHLINYIIYGRAFIHEYFGYHVLERTITAIEGKTHRYLFYFDRYILFFKPWWVLTPFAIFLAVRDNTSAKRPRSWVVFLLAVLVFVVFTIARTQLSWYITPVYPAMAILISALLVRIFHFHRFLKPVVLGFCIFGVSFAISKLGQPYETTDPMDTPIKELSLLARRTDSGDSAPIIVFGGSETSRLSAMFYSERSVEQGTTHPTLPEESPLSRYNVFKPIADITDYSPKRILIKRGDMPALVGYHFDVVAEAGDWVYAWIKKRAPAA